MCVVCLGTRRTREEEREGGGRVSLFVPLHPGLSWEQKPSVRKGWEEREWALDDPLQTPMIHSNVPLFICFPCVGIYTVEQTYINTNTCTHIDTPIAEQRWTSPDLTCSLICFRGDCAPVPYLLYVCARGYVWVCHLTWVFHCFSDWIPETWNLQDPTKKIFHFTPRPLSHSCGDM